MKQSTTVKKGLLYPPAVREAFFGNQEMMDQFHDELGKLFLSLRYAVMSEHTYNKGRAFFRGLWNKYYQSGFVGVAWDHDDAPRCVVYGNVDTHELVFGWDGRNRGSID